jgi:hypothetical protein
MCLGGLAILGVGITMQYIAPLIIKLSEGVQEAAASPKQQVIHRNI